MSDKPRCCEIIYPDTFRVQCRNPGTIEANGKWFCKLHRPGRFGNAKDRQREIAKAKEEVVRLAKAWNDDNDTDYMLADAVDNLLALEAEDA